MKIGVNTFIWTGSFDRTHLPLLGRIKEAGFDGVEIARTSFGGLPAAEIRQECERLALTPLMCTALTGELSLISDDGGTRVRTREFLKEAIECAAMMGADRIVGPLCSPVGYLPGRRRTDDEWKHAVEGLQSLGDLLNEHHVTLAQEPLNRFETFFLNTTADTAKLCAEVNHPRVGLMVDSFHANIEEKSMTQAIRDAGPYLKHVHTCENDRGIPGSGHVEWDEFFAALRSVNYDGWLVIESFAFALKEIAAAACIWRDLAPSAEEIAFAGVKFLRQKAT